ncbi:MAG: DNA polymerase III subunit delta [Bacteroidota bacterium]
MPEVKYKDFQKTLAGSRFAPVYLFYGEEDFLIEECVNTIVAKSVDESTKGFNLDVVYGSKADVKDVIAHASSFPMMSEKRVVVVKEFEKLVSGETAKEIFSAYVDKPLDSTLLLLVSEDPDFRRKPFTDLKKKAEVVACQRLYDNQVPAWISARLEKLGKASDAEAARLLHAYVGNSLRALQNEIDKLLIFIGDRKEISVEDVAAVVGATKGFTVFDLQNAVGRKDMKEATNILERMLESGESPQLIIIMLTRFFLQLYKLSELQQKHVSEGEMASELRISPFYLRSYKEFQSAFSSRHLEEGMKALCQADAELKSTSHDAHSVLTLLLYSLIRGSVEKAAS